MEWSVPDVNISVNVINSIMNVVFLSGRHLILDMNMIRLQPGRCVECDQYRWHGAHDHNKCTAVCSHQAFGLFSGLESELHVNCSVIYPSQLEQTFLIPQGLEGMLASDSQQSLMLGKTSITK